MNNDENNVIVNETTEVAGEQVVESAEAVAAEEAPVVESAPEAAE